MAVSDVFLVKSIFTAGAKGGFKLLAKDYKNWSSYRKKLGEYGFAKPGQDVHHWLIEKGSSSGSGLYWKFINQMWNLKPMKDMTINGIRYNGTVIHQAMHGNSKLLKLSNTEIFLMRLYQTPNWPWAIPSVINYSLKLTD